MAPRCEGFSFWRYMKLKPISNEKGWIIRSPCDRVWFLTYEKVEQDYINYLTEQEGYDCKEALTYVHDTDVSFWLYEQYIWSEVDRDGILLTPRVPKKYVKFLDYWREGYSMTNDCKGVNWND